MSRFVAELRSEISLKNRLMNVIIRKLLWNWSLAKIANKATMRTFFIEIRKELDGRMKQDILPIWENGRGPKFKA